MLIYGVFDTFSGVDATVLRRYFQRASHLIVAVASDSFAQKIHASAARHFAARAEMLESCRFVDRVIPQTSWDQIHTDIINHNISTVVLPSDWPRIDSDLSLLARIETEPSLQFWQQSQHLLYA